MPLAARSSRVPARPTTRVRTVLKALAGGAAAVTVVVGSVAAVLTGTGWMLAASIKARTDIRTTLAPASERIARAAPTAMANRQPVLARLPLSETVRAFETPVLTVALAAPDKTESADDVFADNTTTGSIGPVVAARAVPDVPAPKKPAAPAIPVEAMPAPLPLPRPKLAALGPVQNLGIKPDEDAHPPRTAVYDITAQAVYLPNGETLEAHSGLGDLMDNPKHVRVKNRGPTPPNVYDLKLRESLFHGVQAIRLNPVDEDKMFNRDGILAHSYMLGPNGQSNGCVSFKDYPKFLRAFLRGEIERIVVVERLSKPPAFAKAPALGPRVRSASAM